MTDQYAITIEKFMEMHPELDPSLKPVIEPVLQDSTSQFYNFVMGYLL